MAVDFLFFRSGGVAGMAYLGMLADTIGASQEYFAGIVVSLEPRLFRINLRA